MSKRYYILIGTLLLAVSLIAYERFSRDKVLGADIKIDSKISEIATMEKIKDGKYTQILRKQEDGSDFEVHEYVTPKKEAGYQVIFYKTVDGKNYRKSVGYGPEDKSRTFDWTWEPTPAEIRENNL